MLFRVELFDPEERVEIASLHLMDNFVLIFFDQLGSVFPVQRPDLVIQLQDQSLVVKQLCLDDLSKVDRVFG